nr:lysine--tRNA ligase [uncultured Mogibacterium sp.]
MSNDNHNAPETVELTAEEISEQRKIRREKLQELRDMGRDPFVQEKYNVTAHSKDIKDNFEAMEGEEVAIAGRIMRKRIMGKAAFFDVQDKQGRIQCYIKRDDIGADEYKIFKTYDIGDIVGLRGFVFKTRTDEVSVHTQELTLLSKSLQVLPDKWSGLQDIDLRYRQRYVDLIMNEDVRETFYNRAKIVKTVREVLEEDYGFLEVETPVLQTIAGGANARPFNTHHNALDFDLKLRISLELPLKRLIVGGLDRVYELGKVFRNEGMDKNHSPEFTSMEAYMAYGNLEDMMDLMEQVVYKCAMAVNGSPIITYEGKSFDVTPPWNKIDMTETVIKVTGIPFDKIDDDEEARAAAIKYGMNEEDVKNWTRGKIIAEMFEEYCEDLPGLLDGPVFLTGHPVDVSPLSKRDPKDPRITRRFEAYINGWELSNAFSELNDPIDQYERFAEQQRELDLGIDDEAHPMDTDYVNALEIGLPPTGGIGIGIDRLVMLITDSTTIRDVQLFPTMKSLDGVNKKNDVNNTASEAPEKNVKTESEKIDFSNVKIEPIFEEMVDFDTFSKSDFRAVKILACEAVPKSKKLLKFTLDDGERKDRVILSGIHEYYEPEELVGKTAIAIVNLPPRKMMGIDSEGMLISAVHEEDGHEGLNLLMVNDRIPAGAKLY